MKRNIGAMWLLGAVVGLLACVGMAAAAEEAEQKVTVVGKLSVTEDDDWNVTAAKVTTDGRVVYQIVLDEKGKKLAAEMDGAKVEVTGKLVKKGGPAKWLAVISFKEIVEDDGGDDD